VKKRTKPTPLTAAQQKLVMDTLPFAVGWGSRNCCYARDELTSLCYVALCRAVRKFDPRHPKAIAFPRFCKPYVRGEIRREWRRSKIVKHAEWVVQESEADSNNSLVPRTVDSIDFDSIELNEFRPLLKKCLKLLTPYERQVIRLRFFEGFNLTDIGERMGFCRQAIHMTCSKALRKIRQYLYLIHRQHRDA